MFEIIRCQDPFDAVIVGSGATGGWAAKKLTEAGMRVALLEAGSRTVGRDFVNYESGVSASTLPPSEATKARRPIQTTCYACGEYKGQWFVDDFDNPYVQQKPFKWIRVRALGGRLLAWERQSYRMSDLDFKAASRDGYGDDWPISYQDLVPYYEEVERYIGVSGSAEGLSHLPDGVFASKSLDNVAVKMLREPIGSKFGRIVTPARLAAKTRSYDERDSCFYCETGNSHRMSVCHFSTPWTPLIDAAKTGRLSLLTDAIVSEVVTKGARATGVHYIERYTHAHREISAKIVVLCASTLESTRLLLNSGICNSSGVLGRYLMDHIFQGGAAALVERSSQGRTNLEAELTKVYIPRFRNVKERETNGFIRGYGMQGRSGIAPDRFQSASHSHGSGPTMWLVNLNAYGECLARKENFVAIDPNRVDSWGIPILTIHADWSDNDIKLWKDGRNEATEMLRCIGAAYVERVGEVPPPGLCIHEVGTARMGNDAKSSVVNRFCQCHDVPNIFVMDGACWVSSGCQNPTLTMMAIAGRSCDFITSGYAVDGRL
jgi:choline dehydrogenase-like flavoprotein